MKDIKFTSTDCKDWKFDLNEMLLAKEKLKKMLEPETNIFGISIYENTFVPKGEIWCVNNKKEIFKIINIGNTMNSSKLYRFILWWQKLVRKIKAYCRKVAYLQKEAIEFDEEIKQYMEGKK